MIASLGVYEGIALAILCYAEYCLSIIFNHHCWSLYETVQPTHF